MSPAISKRSATWLLGIVERMKGGEASRVSVDLKHALRLRPGLKIAKAVRAKKKRTKSADTKSIRAAVMERANNVCECGCGKGFTMMAPAQLDHFHGRRVPQTYANTWALRTDCHNFKTLNQPSAEAWLKKFIAHCERQGIYPDVALRRLESLSLQAEARGAP